MHMFFAKNRNLLKLFFILLCFMECFCMQTSLLVSLRQGKFFIKLAGNDYICVMIVFFKKIFFAFS